MIRTFPLFGVMQKKLDRVNSNIQESLRNVRVIKSFVRGHYEEKRFEESNQDLMESSLNAFKAIIATMPLMTLFMNVTTLAVVWFGGNQILAGEMPVGDLTAFITYITQVLMSLMMLAMILLNSSRAIASAKRINEILDKKVELTDENAGCKEQEVKQGRIEFRNVSFRYYKHSEDPVLNNINLKIESGEFVFIVGNSGSGKSTLIKLLLKELEPTSGKIYVNNRYINKLSRKKLPMLRRDIGVVFQDFRLLNDRNVYDNIAFAMKVVEAPQRQIRSKVLAMLSMVGLLDKYRSFPKQMSGGEQQRVALARALVNEPKILLADEPTGNLDPDNAWEIMKLLEEINNKGTTVVVVTHNLEIVKYMKKRVITIQDGNIISDEDMREDVHGGDEDED